MQDGNGNYIYESNLTSICHSRRKRHSEF